jgi:hypothetical protein
VTRKARSPIPTSVAAEVIFRSDRTCCVCRTPNRPTQVHHLDDDPSNHDLANLSLLCLDCHNLTQVRGGFARHLLAEAIVLYRDDWQRRVAASRSAHATEPVAGETPDVELITSIAEIYRDNGELELLAMFYHSIGNDELRNKYIEEVITHDPEDAAVVFLRGLQGRGDLIPADVQEREEVALANDPSQRARYYKAVGRPIDAVRDYLRGALDDLDDDNPFAAGFYIKELVDEGLVSELFKLALDRAIARGDLWWAVRALQELDWDAALRDFLLGHATEIEASKDPFLVQELRRAQGDSGAASQIAKDIARGTHSVGRGCRNATECINGYVADITYLIGSDTPTCESAPGAAP